MLVIFGEEILKVLWPETALVIVSHAVAAVLSFIETVDIDTEERIGEVARDGWVGYAEVNEKGRKEGKWRAPAVATTSVVGILRPDDAVMVGVPVLDMLLNNLRSSSIRLHSSAGFRTYRLVAMVLGVISILGTIRRFF